MRPRSTVPVYPTLTAWNLVEPGSDIWRSVFPFDQAHGMWAFSGRVALHVGLAQLRLPPGSRVLVPSYFQGVEIDTLLHHGHELEFYRVDRHLKVDLSDVERRHPESASAFYVIHYFGWPQDMPAIRTFCDRLGLPVIEDCALSLFSKDSGGWLGRYGDLSLFSVYKTLALPHGGYGLVSGGPPARLPGAPPFVSTLVQLSDLLHQHMKHRGWTGLESGVRRITSFVRERLGWSREQTVTSGGAHWDARLLEYGASALTTSLMGVWDPASVVTLRRRNYCHLAQRLADRARSPLGDLPEHACPLFFPVLVADKIRVMERLAEQGVGSVNLWWEPHAACPPDRAEEVAPLRRNLLELPIHQSLSLDDIDRVADAFLAAIDSGVVRA